MGSQIIRHNLAAEQQGEIKKDSRGTSLVAQCLTIHLPVQGTQAQSLVRELRSHMLQLRPSQINKYLKKKKIEVLGTKRGGMKRPWEESGLMAERVRYMSNQEILIKFMNDP